MRPNIRAPIESLRSGYIYKDITASTLRAKSAYFLRRRPLLLVTMAPRRKLLSGYGALALYPPAFRFFYPLFSDARDSTGSKAPLFAFRPSFIHCRIKYTHTACVLRGEHIKSLLGNDHRDVV